MLSVVVVLVVLCVTAAVVAVGVVLVDGSAKDEGFLPGFRHHNHLLDLFRGKVPNFKFALP